MFIQMDSIRKKFGQKVVLNDVSIQVKQGELLALLGPSGCGKTTLLNALAGLLDIDGGQIRVQDTLFAKAGYTLPAEQRKVGMVFQDFALWPHMTVFDNVAFGLKVQRMPSSEIQRRVRRVLQRVQMSDYATRYPHQLSGGQKQRIAIARALAPEPSLLLMDEPLSNLDAKLRVDMRWQLTELIRTTGVTTVYVTHDQIEALTMADQIVLMNQGVVEQAGSPESLYHTPKTEFTAAFIGSANLRECIILHEHSGVAQIEVGGLRTLARKDASTGANAVWMVRPADIQVLDAPIQSSAEGTGLEAVVMRRAFQGDTWQYQVRIIGNCDVQLEVWNKRAYAVDEVLPLWIPLEAARLVQKAPAQLDAEAAG